MGIKGSFPLLSTQPGNAVPTDLRGERIGVGDRITWTVAASCGRCFNCRDGLEQKCVHLVKYGHEKVTREMPFRGGLADVVLLSPGTGIVKLPAPLPPGITVEMMALANCSTATVAAVLRAGFARRNRPGMSVVVLGVGVLGLTACAMARQIYQAATIIACDSDDGRAERAKLFGATHSCSNLEDLAAIVRQATGNSGVDVAVELAGSIHTARAAAAIARIGGTVVLAGTTMPTEPLMLEPQSIVRRLLRIEGVHNYVGADLVAAVDFLLQFGTAHPFASLIAEHFELAEIESAFARGHHCAGTRVAIHFER
jgi:alcohol dehydrogenase